jgi:hypothetical protein
LALSSTQARNILSSMASRERTHAATARTMFAGAGSLQSRNVLFSVWASHYGSHATTARARVQVARGRLSAYLARHRRHMVAHTPLRLTLDSLLARCGTQVNADRGSAHTAPPQLAPDSLTQSNASFAHVHARHAAGSEHSSTQWLPAVLACTWLDAGAERVHAHAAAAQAMFVGARRSSETHSVQRRRRSIACTRQLWAACCSLMARLPMRNEPRLLEYL